MAEHDGKARKENTKQNEMCLKMEKGDSLFNFTSYTKWRKAEVASAFSFANALSCAKMASMMSNNGVYAGQQILSEETVKDFHADETFEAEGDF